VLAGEPFGLSIRERIGMARLLLVLGMAAWVAGCAEHDARQGCAAGYGPPVTIFRLFLGKAIPGREDVTDKEWSDFLDSTITANLPNGYTVFEARGGWMNPVTRRTVKEATKVLLVALPRDAASLAAINRIRTDYQLKFHQQLVGMTVQEACGAF
jgi:hypothetical protein